MVAANCRRWWCDCCGCACRIIKTTEKIGDKEYICGVKRNDGGALDIFCISSIEKQSDNQFLLSMYST
ncbi:MAG: hypothetical protein LBV69_08260, partial [Bacteroidales bacterium]|nr:hypothetical protein [Bacteroidales bacterium]